MPVMSLYVNDAIDIYLSVRYMTSMSETNSERIITPMPKSLVEKIDDYRFKERIPSRAEAVRRLLEKGLQGQ